MLPRFLLLLLLLQSLFFLGSGLWVFADLEAQERQGMATFLSLAWPGSAPPTEVRRALALHEAQSPARLTARTRKLLLLFGAQGAFLALVAWLYVAFVTRPMRRLDRFMASVSLDGPQPPALEEIGEAGVRRLIRQTNAMLAALHHYQNLVGDRGRYRGWKEMSRIAVHEVNNALSPATLVLESLLVHGHDPGKLRMVHRQISEVRAILGRLRSLSHLPEARCVPTDLRLCLLDLSLEFPAVAFHIPETLPTVSLDPVLFKEALRNLLKNALEAAREPAPSLTAEGAPDGTHLRIRDHGSGLPSAALETVLGEGRTSKAGGMGLGLPLARWMLLEQGHTLGLFPVDGPGTGLRILIPTPGLEKPS